jgi:3-oxoacyl-[acyl-carrier protein] reductase
VESMADKPQKRVIVTGASQGLGRVLSELLAQSGWRVGAVARNSAALENLVSTTGVAAARGADLTDPEAARTAIDELAEELEGLDALVNNAGKVHFQPFEETRSGDYLRVLEQNFLTAVYSTQAALPYLKASEVASLVQISSISGTQPLPGGAAYSAAKHALVGWSRSIFGELREQGIRVSLLHPGSITPNEDESVSENPAMSPHEVARMVLHQLEAPPGTVVSEVEIRPLFRPRR